MSREEQEELIFSKIKNFSEEEFKEVFTIIMAMSFKNEKNLKDYSSFLDKTNSKEARHLKEEFYNYQKKYLRD